MKEIIDAIRSSLGRRMANRDYGRAHGGFGLGMDAEDIKYRWSKKFRFEVEKMHQSQHPTVKGYRSRMLELGSRDCRNHILVERALPLRWYASGWCDQFHFYTEKGTISRELLKKYISMNNVHFNLHFSLKTYEKEVKNITSFLESSEIKKLRKECEDHEEKHEKDMRESRQKKLEK